jgi:hypothetical protein
MKTLHLGDCLEVLRGMPDCSVDAVVTDPPYGLSFMGKKWDYDVPSVEVWAECLRVLKPGGHLLAFAGTRTQHRMAVRIEDAGFEIRDMIAWVYGSGFPKSLDVSKAIDKAAGVEREVVGTRKKNTAVGSNDVMRENGKVTGVANFASVGGDARIKYETIDLDITAPATEAARQWAGWGTALKPALEPITVARKPLAGTVAENVLAHGTGGLNIDGCRVGISADDDIHAKNPNTKGGFGHAGASVYGDSTGAPAYDPSAGRWPANLILSYNEDEFELRSNVTSEQRKQLLLWMYENT